MKKDFLQFGPCDTRWQFQLTFINGVWFWPGYMRQYIQASDLPGVMGKVYSLSIIFLCFNFQFLKFKLVNEKQ